MKVALQDAGPCRKVMDIDVGFADVLEEYQQVASAFTSGVRIKGFRPGRAPMRLVERQYSQEILEEIKDRMIPRCYRDALKDNSLAPVAVVSVENVKLALETGLQFKVTLDVAPEFELPVYMGVELKRNTPPVVDADIDQAIEGFRDNHATYAEAPDAAAAKGDVMEVDFDGTLDGAPLTGIAGLPAELASARGAWLKIGEHDILPGLGEKITGQRVGGVVEHEVPFPVDSRVKELAGKTAKYAVTIKHLRQAQRPVVDDSFAKTLGVESVAELRERVKVSLERVRRREERARLKEGVIQHLLSKVSFELPKSVIEEETSMTAQSMVRRSMEQGASVEDIRSQQESILDAAGKSSIARTRLTYILSKIAARENVTVTEEEMDDEIEAMAERQNMTGRQVRSFLEKRHAMDRLATDIRCEKVLDLLLEKASITD